MKLWLCFNIPVKQPNVSGRKQDAHRLQGHWFASMQKLEQVPGTARIPFSADIVGYNRAVAEGQHRGGLQRAADSSP